MSSIAAAISEKARQLLDLQGLPFAQWQCGDPDQPGGCYMGYAADWSRVLIMHQQGAIYAMARAGVSKGEIDSLDVEDARKAVTDIYMLLETSTGSMLDAIERGDFKNAVLRLPRDTLRKAIVALYVYNSSAAVLHYEGAFERGVLEGRITSQDALSHLNRCAVIFEILDKLGKKGALDWMRSGASGVGVVQGSWPAVVGPRKQEGQGTPIYGVGMPAAIVALLVIGGVLSALIWAGMWYMIVLAFNQARIQSKALDQCDQLLEQGMIDEAQRCRENVLDAANESLNRLMKPVSEAAKTVAMAIGAGILLYVGAKYVLPEVMKATAGKAPSGSAA